MDTSKDKNFITLFITRKYPPQVGGMENFCHGLITNFPGKKYAVTYGGKQKWLPVVYPLLFIRALLICLTKKVDIVHLGDGVMVPLGFVLKIITGKKVVFTAHGKDINLKFKLYQIIMPPFFRKMDHIYCVSNSTVQECIKIGIPKERCTFIPNGVDPEEFKVSQPIVKIREGLSRKYKLDFKNKKILITVGRLSKRKGVMWFVKNVMPKLAKTYMYIVIGGDSTEVNDLKSLFGVKNISYGEKLKKMIKELNLDKNVTWLGKIPFDDLKKFYNMAGLFIMPNIRVKGDMEGFGIVAIEATSTGLPVVASGIEGIKDAVVDGETGSLVESENVGDFMSAIKLWTDEKTRPRKRDQIAEKTRELYSWDSVARKYEENFKRELLQR